MNDIDRGIITLYESAEDADGATVMIDSSYAPRLLFSCHDPSTGTSCVYVDVTDIRIMHAKLGEWLAKYE